MSYLIMRRGPEPGKLYRLETDSVSIGRGSKNDIVIHDNEVSREHLLLSRTEEGYELHDKSSSNGTFVNGQLVDGVWVLQSHCIIELGDSITLEYRIGEPDEAENAEAVPAPDEGAVPYLIVTLSSQTEPAVYPLNDANITVGRSMNCGIVVVEPEMSREHFRLTLTAQGYMIEDMGSTNGTMVNGNLIKEPTLLKAEDIIQIGTMVQMWFTRAPDKFIDAAKTDRLPHQPPVIDQSPTRKRKTSPSEIHSIVLDGTPQPTQEHVVHLNLKDYSLITYARDEWESVVAPLVEHLSDNNVQSWVDQGLTWGSPDWQVATEQARLECWLLVVVVSKAALESELVNRNWRHFRNREKPIILVMREPIENLPIGSSKLQRIHYNPALPQVAYQQLVTEINRLKTERKR